MIVFGSRSSKLKKGQFPEHACVKCGKEDCRVVVRGFYIHLFWAPIFPYKKVLKITCNSCGHRQKQSEVSETVRQRAKKLKSSVKLPLWMYSGNILIVLLIVGSVIYNYIEQQQDLEAINNPTVDNVYIVYDKEGISGYHYYAFKIVDVQGDSIAIAETQHYYDRQPSRLAKEDSFEEFLIKMHKNKLKELYDSGEILETTTVFFFTMGYH